jgi:hypothetical protein
MKSDSQFLKTQLKTEALSDTIRSRQYALLSIKYLSGRLLFVDVRRCTQIIQLYFTFVSCGLYQNGLVIIHIKFDYVETKVKFDERFIFSDLVLYTNIYNSDDTLILKYGNFILSWSSPCNYLFRLMLKDEATASAWCF